MLTVLPPTRNRDKYGAGYFGASRGKRTHNGVDFVVQPHQNVCAFQRGTVTKLGYPYANHLEYRYVEVTDARGYRCRYFYCSPILAVGDVVDRGGVVGIAQDLSKLYPGITPHFHFEVVTGSPKVYHDPFKYLANDI